ncbi:MAG: tRNA (adenosine(37)-N6)-threonylcarbamoyltransferase complex ATPase subunit type 1 TsaE [Acutalibacteraceae bacterium]|nr:tRNA (adenosine(37)-N6)-threonylcarbamoyltransferase complex ATPase subunit type 1 TsaE [Acutalibacteraceae bacterium]
MEKYITSSPEETEKLGCSLGKLLKGGEVIAYRGGLGMGKTCFTRGLAAGLDYKGDVTSPTFALINEYQGGRLPLYHFDMYRISGWEDLYSTGFFEYLEQGGIIAAEWSENIENALPENTIIVSFKDLGDENREITIDGIELKPI